jgi:hypothetical protein
MTAIDDFMPGDSVELAVRKVGANSHIGFCGVYYSAPSDFYKKMVIVRATAHTIEILNSDGVCVASHRRCYTKRRYITDPSHMPPYYLSIMDDSCYDGARLRTWAKDIGKHTLFVIECLLEKYKIEEHSYKSCLAVLLLSKKYGASLLERSCEIAQSRSLYSFAAVKNILLTAYNNRN